MTDHPTLDALLEKFKGYVMSPGEKEAQRRSWFLGELMMLRPEITKDEAIRRYNNAVEECGEFVGNKSESSAAMPNSHHYVRRDLLEEAEAKLAEAQAFNLQLVGAVEPLVKHAEEFFTFLVAERYLLSDAKAALSGDGIEKYRELLDAVDKLLGSLSNPSMKRLRNAFAALQSGEPGK